MATACEKCGRALEIGDFPFCPHGRSALASFRDDIPGGMVLHNYGPTPVTVYSHTERKKLLQRVQFDKTNHLPYTLHEKETYAPLPGTARDPSGIPNPNGYRDLSAGAILARNGRTEPTQLHDSDDLANDPDYRDPHLVLVNQTWEGVVK